MIFDIVNTGQTYVVCILNFQGMESNENILKRIL